MTFLVSCHIYTGNEGHSFQKKKKKKRAKSCSKSLFLDSFLILLDLHDIIEREYA